MENFTQASPDPSGDSHQDPEEIKKELKGLMARFRSFLSEMLNIKKDTDIEATKEAIIKDISFKGHTIWILVCSIFIASVGLNANSTAVVIGAMLISPLMGPILGIGLSFATNDIDTLKRSLLNGAIMVVYSVLTAFLFFEFFPIINNSSELLSRTSPDIRDVLIAFFGGLALVIARAKRGTVATVIFGVAIATALMPPLCTVGFGIAIRNWEYASGALYLFTINAIFIALATFLVLKILRFPMVRYIKSSRRRLYGQLASLVAILIMIPAGITFYEVFQESRYKSQADQFISDTIGIYQFKKRGIFIDDLTDIDYNPKGLSTIELVCMGNEEIPENVIATWETQMEQYSRLTNTELKIVQAGIDDSTEKFDYVNELYEAKKTEIQNKDQRIRLLEEEIALLSKNSKLAIPFDEISAEAKANYEELNGLIFSYSIRTDFKKLDTIPVFELQWDKGIRKNQMDEKSANIRKWLQVRLKDSTVQVRNLGS
jgi:uncharacterized hydrophobic protein (TIGR00271 family)